MTIYSHGEKMMDKKDLIDFIMRRNKDYKVLYDALLPVMTDELYNRTFPIPKSICAYCMIYIKKREDVLLFLSGGMRKIPNDSFWNWYGYGGLDFSDFEICSDEQVTEIIKNNKEDLPGLVWNSLNLKNPHILHYEYHRYSNWVKKDDICSGEQKLMTGETVFL